MTCPDTPAGIDDRKLLITTGFQVMTSVRIGAQINNLDIGPGRSESIEGLPAFGVAGLHIHHRDRPPLPAVRCWQCVNAGIAVKKVAHQSPRSSRPGSAPIYPGAPHPLPPCLDAAPRASAARAARTSARPAPRRCAAA